MMIIKAYHSNYHRYGMKNVKTVKEAEEALNELYFKQGFTKKPALFKIDNSEMMTYNEARIALGFSPSKYVD